MATWLDVAIAGRAWPWAWRVLGGNWTHLGSEARWTSQMPCRRVAIGLKGASERALLLLLGGKPGDAATSTHTGIYIDGPECLRFRSGR